MSKNKPINIYLPALGLVLGAGAGAIVSVFCDFQTAYGLTIGAAGGLLIGIVFLNLFGKKDKFQNGGET